MTKYTDNRQFEVVQLPEFGQNCLDLLPAWLKQSFLISKYFTFDKRGWYIQGKYYRAGDYILRFDDGAIRPIAREEFEKHCRVAGEPIPNKRDIINQLIEAGNTDGAHHKDWFIDQVLRQLMGTHDHNLLVAAGWDEGIAP